MNTLTWALLGSGLCLLEVFLPTAFVAMMLGLSAFLVALLIQLGLVNPWLQIGLWLVFSTGLIGVSRRFVLTKRGRSKLRSAATAETTTEIPAGETGRVLYEGNSWRARCDDETIAIASHERVYVVRREGTTLVVMPQSLLHFDR